MEPKIPASNIIPNQDWKYYPKYLGHDVTLDAQNVDAANPPTSVIASVEINLAQVRDIEIEFSCRGGPNAASTTKKNLLVWIYRDSTLIKGLAGGTYYGGGGDGYHAQVSASTIDEQVEPGYHTYTAKATLINYEGNVSYTGTVRDAEMILKMIKKWNVQTA